MSTTIQSQLIVAKEVHFDELERQHFIHGVVNSHRMTTFPSVAIFDVVVKLSWEGEFEQEAELIVVNPDDEILYSLTFDVSNKRKPEAPPGMEVSFNTRFVTLKRGVYVYKLLFPEMNDEPVFTYPVLVE